MNVVVNGQSQDVQPCTVAELVYAKGLSSRSLVVELNGQIIKEAQWSSLHLRENDRLELLGFVGGG